MMKKTMKMKLLALTVMICLICTMPAAAFGANVDSTIPVYMETVRYDQAAEEVLELVNAARAEAGLSELVMDSNLQEAAMTRAMESAVYFSHTRPDGTSCVTAEPVSMVGENLAVGQGSPESAVKAWMNSAAHKANILNSSYNSIGIGCIYYNGVWFWSQAFGRTSGDGEVPSSNTDVSREIGLLTGLVQLTWMGDSKIDLAAADDDAALKAHVGTINAGWEYMTVGLDNSLFTFSSSDDSVIRVDEDGTLTPASVGTATITVTLKANKVRQLTQEISVVRTLKAEDVSLSYTSCTYSGKAKKPTVTVEGLTEDDYVVSYKNNVKVGTATVTITGVGDVDGTVTKTFKINYNRPDKVTLKKPTTGKTHYVKVRWYAEDCDGYAIRYSTSKTFKTYKTVFVKDGDDVSKTIKNLTKGKRYYVKVRAYNLYEGTRVYGKWSSWKSVVCK